MPHQANGHLNPRVKFRKAEVKSPVVSTLSQKADGKDPDVTALVQKEEARAIVPTNSTRIVRDNEALQMNNVQVIPRIDSPPQIIWEKEALVQVDERHESE